MHNHSEDGSDLVVSLDAFKVTRPGVLDHGDAGRWKVNALYSWSQEMLIRYAGKLNPKDYPIWVREGASQRIVGARFERRVDALEFLREVERLS
jgi:hypothetical protein